MKTGNIHWTIHRPSRHKNVEYKMRHNGLRKSGRSWFHQNAGLTSTLPLRPAFHLLLAIIGAKLIQAFNAHRLCPSFVYVIWITFSFLWCKRGKKSFLGRFPYFDIRLVWRYTRTMGMHTGSSGSNRWSLRSPSSHACHFLPFTTKAEKCFNKVNDGIIFLFAFDQSHYLASAKWYALM